MNKLRTLPKVAAVVIPMSIYLLGCSMHEPMHPIQGVAGVVIDQIDERIVVKSIANPETEAAREISISDGLKWDIIAGDAQISEDPFTGLTLFAPKGNVPLVARPRIGEVVGTDIVIGIDPGSLPSGERNFLVPGGGSCNTDNFLVDVRSVVDATVIPLSQSQRLIRYAHGEYYAHNDIVGPMRITYNPTRVSETTLISQSPTDSKIFFPALAESKMFFIIEILSSGQKMFNKDPMTLKSAATSWPPFREPQINDVDVVFFDLEDPNVETMRIRSQELYIYPTQELDVEIEKFRINHGMLEAKFRVTNKSSSSGHVRWFLLGNIGDHVSPRRGSMAINAEGSHTVNFKSKLQKSSLTQFITFGAVSQSGTRLSGFARRDFNYPRKSTE